MNNKFYLFFIFLFFSIESFSQVAVPFTARRQMYVKGDMTMIANNIVNRKDFFNSPNSPYDKVNNKAKLNDQLDMQYIDIDDDKTTFSSSSANLILENPNNKKIVYAGLYWSATYTTKSSKSPKVNVYTAIDTTRESFDKIKIKLPNESNYNDIQGKLIFDGLNEADFKENAPYAMYADITELVKKVNSPIGTYTVANIKSTVGVVSGGVSGGWSIFFIYEDINMTSKFITTYDGFAGVTKTSVDVNFTGFQTLPSGTINAKIACAALEGDLNLTGDQIYVKSVYVKDFSQISDVIRDETNVFNSSISINDKYFSDRFPNSVNTLGYDSFIMPIHNPDNSVIQNNTKGATVKFKSYGDRYFVFFNAFNVEVNPPIAPVNIIQPVELLADVNQKKAVDGIEIDATVAAAKEAKSIEKESLVSLIVKNDNETIGTKSNNNTTSNASSTVKKNNAVADKDYYLVAGVFGVHSNATKLIAKLKSQGIEAYYVTNPKNNYRYVYISKPDTYKETSKLHASKLNGKYNKDIWVFGLKKQDNSSIAEHKSSDKTPVINKKPILTNKNNTIAQSNKPENKKEVLKPSGTTLKNISINNKDYYLVVGVFRIHSNATNLVAKLKSKGIEAYSFVNPKNKFRYVYVSKNKSYKEASSLCENKMNGKYNKEIWVFGINQQNNIVGTE